MLGVYGIERAVFRYQLQELMPRGEVVVDGGWWMGLRRAGKAWWRGLVHDDIAIMGGIGNRMVAVGGRWSRRQQCVLPLFGFHIMIMVIVHGGIHALVSRILRPGKTAASLIRRVGQGVGVGVGAVGV